MPSYVCRRTEIWEKPLKQRLHKCKITLINVPGGTTSRVQPLDVSINRSLKNYGRALSKQRFDGNMMLCVEGKLAVGERRVLTTKMGSQSVGSCEETNGCY